MSQTSSSSDHLNPGNRVNLSLGELHGQVMELADTLRCGFRDGNVLQDRLDCLARHVEELISRPHLVQNEADRGLVAEILSTIRDLQQEGASWISQVAIPELERLNLQWLAVATYRMRSNS